MEATRHAQRVATGTAGGQWMAGMGNEMNLVLLAVSRRASDEILGSIVFASFFLPPCAPELAHNNII